MKRQSIALFLTTLALAGGTVACGGSPDGGEQGGDQKQELNKAAPADDGEGGEGGEG